MKTIAGVFGLACVALLLPDAAMAQATRTWVSGVGDDVNPCSRTAPCKTFAGAISKTAINGEINCLDPAGFGAITITKSITIDCHEIFASILASGFTGVIISIAAGNANDPLRTVRLRNLNINGAGASGTVGTRTGIKGIRIDAALAVYIDDSMVSDFTTDGILDQRSGAGTLHISNTTVRNNAGAGILIKPGASATVNASLNGVRVLNNQVGMRVEDRGKATVFQSIASGNIGNGFLAFSASAAAEINLINSVASNTGTNGVATSGSGAVIRMVNSVTVHNGVGISRPSGIVAGTTPDTNVVEGNTTDGDINANMTMQ